MKVSTARRVAECALVAVCALPLAAQEARVIDDCTFDDGFRMPAAGILVRNPNDLPARRITVDGRESSPDENGDLLLLGPAREVRFSF